MECLEQIWAALLCQLTQIHHEYDTKIAADLGFGRAHRLLQPYWRIAIIAYPLGRRIGGCTA